MFHRILLCDLCLPSVPQWLKIVANMHTFGVSEGLIPVPAFLPTVGRPSSWLRMVVSFIFMFWSPHPKQRKRMVQNIGRETTDQQTSDRPAGFECAPRPGDNIPDPSPRGLRRWQRRRGCGNRRHRCRTICSPRKVRSCGFGAPGCQAVRSNGSGRVFPRSRDCHPPRFGRRAFVSHCQA